MSTSFAEVNALEFALTPNHELNNDNNWLTSNRFVLNADRAKYLILLCIQLFHLIN